MKRKSHAVRLGILALALTLVTTSLLGGTMAKYVTEVTGTATATVAQWSFTANGEAEQISSAIDLASTTYNAGTIAAKKVAPGTSGSFTITLDGSGSDVGIDYTIAITKNNASADLPTDLVFSTEAITEANPGKNLADLQSNLTGNIPYKSGANNMKKDVIIYWSWPFESTQQGSDKDKKDTALGEAAPNTGTLDITVTGEQVKPTA